MATCQPTVRRVGWHTGAEVPPTYSKKKEKKKPFNSVFLLFFH